ncbi:MAG: signal peptidase II [Oscillospiraceae bacterium]|jgi:signal peptidase II|nr:signal peptidase II [Oscillospiraceae bacterium]MCR5262574.1 signal peptidase II [Clostridiales bacterium]
MLFFIISIIIVIADQAMKYFVTIKLALGGQLPLIPGIIHLTYVRNTGAAHSILTEYTWLLTIISALASVIIIILIIKMKIGTFGRVTLACVLGGAVGNLIDRAALGYVVDMFEVEFMNYAVFNVADMFISVCGVLFCIYYIVYSAKKDKTAKKKSVPLEEIFKPDDGELTDTHVLTEYELNRLLSEDGIEHDIGGEEGYLPFTDDDYGLTSDSAGPEENDAHNDD